MTKVLIVEDSFFIRNEISNMIESHCHGFSVLGLVCNGQEALDFISNNQPDIVITDIQMPVMNGLELIKNVKSKFNSIEFIMLSAYDEFNYVRKAFQYGAVDYILKLDLLEEVLFDVLKKCARKISERAEIEEHYLSDMQNMKRLSKVEDYILKNNILKEGLFKEIISGLIDNRKFSEITSYENYKRFLDNRLLIIALRISNYTLIRKNEWDGKDELLKYGINNVLNEILAENNLDGEVFSLQDGEYIALICCSNINMQNHIKKQVYQFFTDANRAIKFCFSTEIWGGYVGNFVSYNELQTSYKNAKIAADYYFFKGKGKIYEYQELNEKFDLKMLTKLLKQYLVSFDIRLRNEMLEKINSANNSLSCVLEIKNSFTSLFQILNDYYYEYNIKSDILQSDFKDYSNVLKFYGKFKEVLNLFEKDLNEIKNLVVSNSNLAQKAYRYIQTNSRNLDMSLTNVALHFGVSDSHLSRAFVKEYDENFVNLLAKIRIDDAINLIKSRKYKINKISQIVGFQTPQYFNKVFKKQTGVVPSEYIV